MTAQSRAIVLIATLTIAGSAATASATAIHVLPAAQVVQSGDVVSLDLVITALGGSVVGDFDVDVAFDPAVLSMMSVDLGSALGEVSAGDALDFSLGLVGPGVLNLALVSVLSPAALDARQAESFALATLLFRVLTLPPGARTGVDVSAVNALGDGAGLPIAVSARVAATLTGSSGGPPPVPEPASTALLIVGIAAVLRRSTRRRSAVASQDCDGDSSPAGRRAATCSVSRWSSARFMSSIER